jgi:(p)ppGpp synthase/HD superfamily hydrolase
MKDPAGFAYQVALNGHDGQMYGTEPYIHHVIDVNDRLKELFPTLSEISLPIAEAVSFLHDVVEDTDITLENLKVFGFPQEVIDGVDAMTKRDGESYDEYIERLSGNLIAVMVKIADSYSNLTASIISGGTKRIAKYTKNIEILSKFL